jgi:hypothetical protein
MVRDVRWFACAVALCGAAVFAREPKPARVISVTGTAETNV